MNRLNFSPNDGNLSRMVRYRRRMLPVAAFGLFLLLIQPCGYASQNPVVLLSSGSAPVYQQVSRDFQSYLAESCRENSANCIQNPIILLTQERDDERIYFPPDTRLIITLGQRAAEMVHKMNTELPILHALIPRLAYQRLGKIKNHSVIFLDQPIRRQLRLAKIIRPDPHVGLLLSRITKAIQHEIMTEAAKLGIPVSYRHVDDVEMIGPLLTAVLEESNILLALPDPVIFNRTTIFNILLSSYHNQIPVIGFSAAYVQAGALIAAYSTPADMARHLAEYTRDYLTADTEELPDPTYPKYFSIAVNRSVARSLGISLPDEADILRLLLEEGNP